MENKYVVKVSENVKVQKLESLSFGDLYELMGGNKELPINESEFNSIKPILTNLQSFLDNQNHTKEKVSPNLTAKEKLLFMKYLFSPIIREEYLKKRDIIKFLSLICDLDESSITSASKDLNKDYAGYTIGNYVKHLNHIRDVFKDFIPKSYNANIRADKLTYEKIFNIIEKVEQDIKKVEDSPEGKKL